MDTTFADLPEGAVFGDGKEGVFLKVKPFFAPPAGFRSQTEANALELASPGMFAPAWFAPDFDGLVFPLPEAGAKGAGGLRA